MATTWSSVITHFSLPASDSSLCGLCARARARCRMSGKSEAVLELGGHSHWVWRVQFNAFHDQLLASSSSDTLVNLYHTPQVGVPQRTTGTPLQGSPKSVLERDPDGLKGRGTATPCV